MDTIIGLIRFSLILWGIVYLITESWIFMYLRIFIAKGSLTRAMFIYCSSCVGAWVGLCLTACGFWPFGHHQLFEAFFSSMALGKIWSLISSNAFETEHTLLDIEELRGQEHDKTSESKNG